MKKIFTFIGLYNYFLNARYGGLQSFGAGQILNGSGSRDLKKKNWLRLFEFKKSAPARFPSILNTWLWLPILATAPTFTNSSSGSDKKGRNQQATAPKPYSVIICSKSYFLSRNKGKNSNV